MHFLLKLSRAIDALNERVGKAAYWLVLVAVLISAGNAIYLYLFSDSSNAWLELQWYLFSAIFLLCGGYALLHNQHVRIDIISSRFSRRTQAVIDIFGTVFFLLPMATLILYLSWPGFINAFYNNEMSSNAGGLKIWPARLLIPVGLTLLVLQGFSEIIKRIGFVFGLAPDPLEKPKDHSAEEELARAILQQHETGQADAIKLTETNVSDASKRSAP